MLIILFAIIALAVGADQLTKALIYGHDAPFIEGFIRFESTENRGVAWGFMNGVNGAAVVITIITAVIAVLLIFLMVKYRKATPYVVGVPLAMVIGGALGNLIDRVFLGYVRDFICTEFITFPVFNVADAFVTCGGIMLVAALFLTKRGREFTSVIFPDEKKKTDA